MSEVSVQCELSAGAVRSLSEVVGVGEGSEVPDR